MGCSLDQAALHPDARPVRFISVTSYCWSLPLEEARAALLATHTGEERLSYEHGFPLRLARACELLLRDRDSQKR